MARRSGGGAGRKDKNQAATAAAAAAAAWTSTASARVADGTAAEDHNNHNHNDDDDDDDEVTIPEATWPEAMPHPQQELIFTVSCGNTHYYWAMHTGPSSELLANLYWR